jgi:hypothetical protein
LKEGEKADPGRFEDLAVRLIDESTKSRPRDAGRWAVKKLKGGGRECRGTAGVSRRRVFVIRKRTKMLWFWELSGVMVKLDILIHNYYPVTVQRSCG